ncbi:hypothetical protein D3C77_494930 [compost metagenome]
MPVMLLHVHHMLMTDQGEYVISDETGQQLKLSDISTMEQGTLQFLPYIQQNLWRNVELLVMFHYETASGTLAVQPLTFIQGQQIVRLLY